MENYEDSVDVLVVGGGTAGTIAAIQAGRAGAKTMLVEHGGQLGGTMTTGGVAFPGLFHAWGEQIISGIGWELVTETVRLDNGVFPNFKDLSLRHWKHQFNINQYLYVLIAEEKCIQAGVQIVYYETPFSVKKLDDGWRVECIGSGVHRVVDCKQIMALSQNEWVIYYFFVRLRCSRSLIMINCHAFHTWLLMLNSFAVLRLRSSQILVAPYAIRGNYY